MTDGPASPKQNSGQCFHPAPAASQQLAMAHAQQQQPSILRALQQTYMHPQPLLDRTRTSTSQPLTSSAPPKLSRAHDEHSACLAATTTMDCSPPVQTAPFCRCWPQRCWPEAPKSEDSASHVDGFHVSESAYKEAYAAQRVVTRRRGQGTRMGTQPATRASRTPETSAPAATETHPRAKQGRPGPQKQAK